MQYRDESLGGILSIATAAMEWMVSATEGNQAATDAASMKAKITADSNRAKTVQAETEKIVESGLVKQQKINEIEKFKKRDTIVTAIVLGGIAVAGFAAYKLS